MLSRLLYRYVVIPAYESLYQGRRTLGFWRQLERSQWLSREELADRQFHAMQDLLLHAAENCPYYRQRWQECGLRPEQLQCAADLRRWPLLDKQQVREHRQVMRSQRDVGRIISKSTGGSTGVPVHFDLDLGSHERRFAAMYRGYGWAGGAPGSKQFHLWGVPLEPRSRWKAWKDRLYDAVQRRYLVNTFQLSEQAVPRIHADLNRHRPDVIVAYTGALYQLARGLAERDLRPCRPNALIVGAEKLHDFQRELIEEVFQAPVFETYGSREFMLIGAECSRHCGLHLTTEHLYVEILDDDGRTTPDGQVGNVVVTDLYNFGMPLIRYALGDQAVAGLTECDCGRGLPLLRSVRGRQLDVVFTPDGRTIPGELFPHLIKDYAEIRQFQIVQSSPEQLKLRVVLAPSWTDSQRDQLLNQIRQVTGPWLTVLWQPVSSIALTQAGKHRVVVNQVSQKREASPQITRISDRLSSPPLSQAAPCPH